MEGSGNDDILTFAINQGRVGVYHVLACRTTAGIDCSAGNRLEPTALTTSFMRQATKAGIGEACAKLRGDSEMSLGRWTMRGRWRDNNPGGRHQGIVVEIPYKGQIVGSAVRTTEVICSLGSSRMPVEAGVRPWRVVGDAKQKIKATLELSVSKVINNVHRIPPENESGAAAHQ